MTVAPRIPKAINSAAVLGIAGVTAPNTTAFQSGLASTIVYAKHSPMVATRTMMIASILRNPRLTSNSKSKTSRPVRTTPHTSGNPNSKLSATADPITSAKSHAMIAISHSNHRAIPTGRA
ncbi:hypothetical protein ABIC16_002593 [Sphingomonas sp. PvP055]